MNYFWFGDNMPAIMPGFLKIVRNDFAGHNLIYDNTQRLGHIQETFKSFLYTDTQTQTHSTPRHKNKNNFFNK